MVINVSFFNFSVLMVKITVNSIQEDNTRVSHIIFTIFRQIYKIVKRFRNFSWKILFGKSTKGLSNEIGSVTCNKRHLVKLIIGTFATCWTVTSLDFQLMVITYQFITILRKCIFVYEFANILSFIIRVCC